MKIFFDTGIFIALFVSQEKYHQKVVDQYHKYRKQRAAFYSSYFILDELYTRLIYDFGKSTTGKIIKTLTESFDKEEIILMDVDKIIFQKSSEILLKFSEHKLSLTDATTYILYKDFKFDEIFTLDSDFKKIGAKTSF